MGNTTSNSNGGSHKKHKKKKKKKKQAQPVTIKSFASNCSKDLARQGAHQAIVRVRDGRVYAVARTQIRTRGQQGGFVFWIVNPKPSQLKLLSKDQDWSLRYGDIFRGKTDDMDFRTVRAEAGSSKQSDVYLMHATVSVGIDDDHVWNAIQRAMDNVAEFTLAGSCDLSGTNPPGWAPGTYRVDLYVREIGESLDSTTVYQTSTKSKNFGVREEKSKSKIILPNPPPLENDWFMNGTHRITESIVFDVHPGDKGTAVRVQDVERQPHPSMYVVKDKSGGETQIFESAVVAEGLDVGPNVHSFAVNTDAMLAKMGVHQREMGTRDGCVYAVAQTGIRTRRQQAGFVFWIERPTREQLAQLSVDQDWSGRYGGLMLPERIRQQSHETALDAAMEPRLDNLEVPEYQRTVRHAEEEGGDVLLSHYMLELGVDDDLMWQEVQNNPEIAKSAEFTLSSNLDLSHTNPPGWAPGRYRVDLYICEVGDLVPVNVMSRHNSAQKSRGSSAASSPSHKKRNSYKAEDSDESITPSEARLVEEVSSDGEDDDEVKAAPASSASSVSPQTSPPPKQINGLRGDNASEGGAAPHSNTDGEGEGKGAAADATGEEGEEVDAIEAALNSSAAVGASEETPTKASSPRLSGGAGKRRDGEYSSEDDEEDSEAYERRKPAQGRVGTDDEGQTNTTTTLGTGKDTMAYASDDSDSDSSSEEVAAGPVEEPEEDVQEKLKRPWSRTGLEPRVTELDQPPARKYSLNDENWFMLGTHPITRSVWFTVKAPTGGSVSGRRVID